MLQDTLLLFRVIFQVGPDGRDSHFRFRHNLFINEKLADRAVLQTVRAGKAHRANRMIRQLDPAGSLNVEQEGIKRILKKGQFLST